MAHFAKKSPPEKTMLVRIGDDETQAHFCCFVGNDFVKVRVGNEDIIAKRKQLRFLNAMDFFHVQVSCLSQLIWLYSICPKHERDCMECRNIPLFIESLLSRIHRGRRDMVDADLPKFTRLELDHDKKCLCLYTVSHDKPVAYLSRQDSFVPHKPVEINMDSKDEEFDISNMDAIIINYEGGCMTFPVSWKELFSSADVLRAFFMCGSARIALRKWLRTFEKCLLNKHNVTFNIQDQTFTFNSSIICGLHVPMDHFMMHLLSDAHFSTRLDLKCSIDPDQMPAKIVRGAMVTLRGTSNRHVTRYAEDNGIVLSGEDKLPSSDCVYDPVSFLHTQYATSLWIMHRIWGVVDYESGWNLSLPPLSESGTIQIHYICKHNSFYVSDSNTCFFKTELGEKIFVWICTNILKTYQLISERSIDNIQMLNRGMLEVGTDIFGPLLIPNFDHDMAEMAKSLCVLQLKKFTWKLSMEWSELNKNMAFHITFDNETGQTGSKKKKKKKGVSTLQ